MSTSIEDSVARIQQVWYAFPPAGDQQVSRAYQRGIPDELIEFYRLSDGALLGHGRDFTGPDGRSFRLKIPPLESIETTRENGYVAVDSPLFERAGDWWQVVDYGDANWLAYDGPSGQVIDIWHETAGEPGNHSIVAASFGDLLRRLLEHGSPFWFREDFEPLGTV